MRRVRRDKQGGPSLQDRLHEIPRMIFWPDPTPLESQPNLAAAAGAASILVKRNDANDLAVGGN